MTRKPLTDKNGRALCLNYRNGKRCRRLARVEGYWSDPKIGGGQTYHMAMCEECAKARNAEIVQRSQKGFTVSTPQFGPTYRVYHSIDEQPDDDPGCTAGEHICMWNTCAACKFHRGITVHEPVPLEAQENEIPF